ncbi:esterase/lipase family protein [Corynebacterium halotolerans]|uniref:Triacylglycerol lipase n=1 Tax=Corynebacterium halotolerans YIM 70093 = DSM 44683 TaxID=1121362 RepID=M1P1Q4_9CORY|nr:alpha/beta fold hydrolase [Corynebacterium halotolerans]AGF73745.1 triacylglycerol lipase precursor [Corynebacterium halotolerans YIM 70093 = DSM 44683]
MTSLRRGLPAVAAAAAGVVLAATVPTVATVAISPAHAQSHQVNTLLSSGSSVSREHGSAAELSSGPIVDLAGGSSLARETGSTVHLSSDPAVDAVFNDPSCVPSPDHPNPVVYLHGTGTSSAQFLETARWLRAQGFCLWAIHYGSGHPNLRNVVPGEHGWADIDASAAEIAVFVDGALAATGAEKVDLVGHSQGGTLTKVYVQRYGGAGKVGRVVALGATFRGTTLDGRDTWARSAVDTAPSSSAAIVGESALQQLAGSEYITGVGELPDTTPGIIYTALYTPSDTTATPYTTSLLESVDGADVANIDVEATCGVPVSHGDLARSPVVAGLVRWGLTRAEGEHAADAEQCGVD